MRRTIKKINTLKLWDAYTDRIIHDGTSEMRAFLKTIKNIAIKEE